MITDHVYRPEPFGSSTRSRREAATRPCHYMSCRRPESEHERSFKGKAGGVR